MKTDLRVGVAGLGTVGAGVVECLTQMSEVLEARAGRRVVITAVSARSRKRNRGPDISSLAWFDNPLALAQSDTIDVFVELIGGDDGPARTSVEAALAAGKHVVTANKALLARHGTALALAAEARGLALNFEAAVAGGIPIVKTLREALAGNRVGRLFGILNGTCNYILTRMASDERSFESVLREAQDRGYAEADPAFDVGGFDTAHKLALLTSLAFGTQVNLDAITIEGIEAITLADIHNAWDLGYKIKLLGVAVATPEGIEQRVQPTLLKRGTSVSDTDGVFNAVVVKGDFSGDLMLEGRGAGGHPTASSVVSDLVDIARGNIRPVFGIPAKDLLPCLPAPARAHEGGYYVALDLYDRPGQVAAVAQILARNSISIESIVQRPAPEAGATAPFILITHNTVDSAMRTALGAIEAEGHVATVPRMIRIERL